MSEALTSNVAIDPPATDAAAPRLTSNVMMRPPPMRPELNTRARELGFDAAKVNDFQNIAFTIR
jgi:hypothetical protein